jgi:putative ABC transport system permease protein
MASPGYFRTMGIPFLQGRDFTGRDVETAPAVVIVDERIARRFWPGQNPIGKRITFSDAETNAVWLSVVGVVADVQGSWPAKDSFAHIYAPYTQMPIDSMFVVMRTNTDPNSYIPAVRQQLRSLDPEQPIYAVKTMEQYVSAAMAQPELRAVLLAVFAGIALVLAAVGTYGVMAFLVAERRHEIGIRLALGAEPRAVLRMVVGYGIILTLAGLGIGLAGATALARILSGLLYGMSATDPMTFVALAVSLGVVSLVAAYVPARRATKVDPIVALRHE